MEGLLFIMSNIVKNNPLDNNDRVFITRIGPDGGELGSVTLADLVSSVTGFGYYIDSNSSAQSFLSDTREQFTNDKSVALEGQVPSDVSTFFENNVVTGVSGDDRVVRIQFDAIPRASSTSSVLIELDIRGNQGVIDRKRVPLMTGLGAPQEVSESFELFCGDTFEANGCTVFLTFDGPTDITNKTTLVKRTHKAVSTQ